MTRSNPSRNKASFCVKLIRDKYPFGIFSVHHQEFRAYTIVTSNNTESTKTATGFKAVFATDSLPHVTSADSKLKGLRPVKQNIRDIRDTCFCSKENPQNGHFANGTQEKYLENRQRLDKLDPDALESFALHLLEMIGREKEGAQPSHDLEVLEQSMKHLKQDSNLLRNYEPNTDDYDFTRNDCKNLLNSTKKWLKMEGLI